MSSSWASDAQPKYVPVVVSHDASNRYSDSNHKCARAVLTVFLVFNVLYLIACMFGLTIGLPKSGYNNRNSSFSDNVLVFSDDVLSLHADIGVAVFLSIASIVLEGLALDGILKKNSALYWPYLIVTFIQLVVLYAVTVLLFICAFLALVAASSEEGNRSQVAGGAAVVCILFGCLYGMYTGLMHYYGYTIVNRSRKDMEYEDKWNETKDTKWATILTTIPTLISTVFTVLWSGLMLYGQATKKPGFDWPYLIVTFINMIGPVIGAIAFLALSILILTGVYALAEENQNKRLGIGIIFLVTDFIIFLFAFLNYYLFFSIPNRSRRVLEVERRSPRHKLTSTVATTTAPYNEAYLDVGDRHPIELRL